MSVNSPLSGSNQLSSNTNSQEEHYNIQMIEQYIENLLNLLIQGLLKLEIEENFFDKFQFVFDNCDSLEEYLDGLYKMLKVLVNKMSSKLSVLSVKKTLDSSVRMTTGSIFLPKKNKLSDESYQNLEKVLQKYEAEIRDHIRIEQQLKIYSDELEEKINEREIKMAKELTKFEDQIQSMNEEKIRLSKLVYEINLENSLLQKKLKRKSKVSLYRSKDLYSLSMKKVMPFI